MEQRKRLGTTWTRTKGTMKKWALMNPKFDRGKWSKNTMVTNIWTIWIFSLTLNINRKW